MSNAAVAFETYRELRRNRWKSILRLHHESRISPSVKQLEAVVDNIKRMALSNSLKMKGIRSMGRLRDELMLPYKMFRNWERFFAVGQRPRPRGPTRDAPHLAYVRAADYVKLASTLGNQWIANEPSSSSCTDRSNQRRSSCIDRPVELKACPE